ncbi:non-ribosomal peptide synthetase [Streptomyces sp. DSM 44938]|uniref:Non-ribosomal peptide synthetase n=1 Tax=Streptomyces litchfieldiae TaxID=3075543 RepID=A0ABU2MRG0_9ACTN|nr:non-ribosomal peptide synthetase [Streptomyces sp. DSM 44938]MDT0343992.1 non-ribosomal peptide synthetase [Streptomyces sp. DSM 44938]
MVVIGGEEVRAPAVRSWVSRVPREVRLVNTYGQTETTLVTHAADLGGDAGRALTDDRRVPIGRPLPHVRQVVRGLAPGVRSGELLIGGPSLASGYQGRPDLTAERFTGDPADPEGRLFRTGDVVEVLPDERLVWLGRVDRQLKIRGFRIEPEEVERALGAHPGVRDVAVHAPPGPDGARRLAALVVPATGARPSVTELLDWLRVRLPPHLLPGLLHFASHLPVLPNGKTDYAMLEDGKIPQDPAPGPDPGAAAAEIAALAGAILGRPYGVDDDFFEAGGDSLLAARLISRIYRRFDVELTFVDIFERRTPSALAERLRAPEASPAGPEGRP